MTTRLPDLMTVYTENETRSFKGAQGVFEDVRCNLEMTEDVLRVTVCAGDAGSLYPPALAF